MKAMYKTVFIALMASLSFTAFGNFSIDMSREDMKNVTDDIQVQDLLVGDSALISRARSVCRIQNKLFIVASKVIRTEASKYSGSFKIKVLPGRKVSLTLEPSSSDIEDSEVTKFYRTTAERFYDAIKCSLIENFEQDPGQPFEIVEIEGTQTLSDFVDKFSLRRPSKKLLMLRAIQDELKTTYVNLITSKVKEQWRYNGAKDNWGCDVYILIDVNGKVQSANLQSCNIDDNSKAKSFKNSIERAIYKASPLPLAPDASVSDREILFYFKVN